MIAESGELGGGEAPRPPTRLNTRESRPASAPLPESIQVCVTSEGRHRTMRQTRLLQGRSPDPAVNPASRISLTRPRSIPRYLDLDGSS